MEDDIREYVFDFGDKSIHVTVGSIVTRNEPLEIAEVRALFRIICRNLAEGGKREHFQNAIGVVYVKVNIK